MSPVFLLIPILLPIAGGLAMLIRPLKKEKKRRESAAKSWPF